MKRAIILIALLSAGLLTYAQNAASVVMTPSDADAFTTNVSLVFDVSGTTMADQSEAWVWSWATGASPAEMKICGTEWGNILPSAKLARVPGEANKYQIVLPLTTTIGGEEVTFNTLADLFHIAPGKLLEIGFLIRSQDGSLQTDGDMKTKVNLSPLTFEDKEYRSFPSKVSVYDAVTVYLNQSLSDNAEVHIMKDITVDIELLDEGGSTIITSADNIVVQESNGAWSFTFMPERLADFPEGKTLEDISSFKTTFKGSLNASGTPHEVSRVFNQDFSDYK